LKIVSGSASTTLARELARTTGHPLLVSEWKSFPDGEFKVRIPEPVAGEDVVLVQSTYPPEKVLELFFLQDALREGNARRITLVIPYFGFGRQDRPFEPGEGVSSRALVRRIEGEADLIISVDIHNDRVLGYFQVPVKNVSGAPSLGRFLRARDIDMVLAPDLNASRFAKAVAALVGCPWEFLEKSRIDSWTVETKAKSLEVAGLGVAIVDDVISTGGTIANAARVLKDQGARKVIAACVHGVFIDGALDRLSICDVVVATDTIESARARVSVAPEVAEALPPSKGRRGGSP
jgi:ribose-phosphate pyrophosphokinase